MVCKNRGIYYFLGTSWVLITLRASRDSRSFQSGSKTCACRLKVRG